MEREPVLTAGAITAAIAAVLYMLVTLDVLRLTAEQQTAIMAAVAAVLPLAMAIVARERVTPMDDPRDFDGTPLVRWDD